MKICIKFMYVLKSLRKYIYIITRIPKLDVNFTDNAGTTAVPTPALCRGSTVHMKTGEECELLNETKPYYKYQLHDVSEYNKRQVNLSSCFAVRHSKFATKFGMCSVFHTYLGLRRRLHYVVTYGQLLNPSVEHEHILADLGGRTMK
jgi:hypothetical protein